MTLIDFRPVGDMRIVKTRTELRILLMEDPLRQVRLRSGTSEFVSHCGGQGYVRHDCSAGLHINEILVPRNVFQKIPKALHDYFLLSQINCGLNCGWFHKGLGHSRFYRNWFLDRVIEIYTEEVVENWIANMPLKYSELRDKRRLI